MAEITKRSGQSEPLDMEKVRKAIQKAAIDADKSVSDMQDKIDSLVKEVSGQIEREAKTTDDVRNIIMSKLEDAEPAVAEAWKDFEEKYSKRE